MKVEILDEAERDLVEGHRFYESQAVGLGDYFLDSLFSDIDSLRLYAGIIHGTSAITAFSQNASRLPCITRLSGRLPE